MRRVAKFTATGILCFAFQYSVLRLLSHEGVLPAAAEYLAYSLAAQLNCFLSYRFTWCDSTRRRGAGLLATWLSFNGVIVCSALANSAVYAVSRHATSDLIALGLAQATSTVINFAVNHFVVMRPERESEGALS